MLLFVLLLMFSCEKTSMNSNPEADFLIPPNPNIVNTQIKLVSQSTDKEDGYISYYKWDTDGNNMFDKEGEGMNIINVIYNRPDTIEVTLQVHDRQGWSDKVTKKLIIVEKIQ